MFWRNISFRKKTILYTSMILYIFILLFSFLIYNQAVHSMGEISEQGIEQRLLSLDEELKSKLSTYSAVTSTLLLDANFQKKLLECPFTFYDAIQYDSELEEYLNTLCSSVSTPSKWELYFTYERPASSHSNIYAVKEADNTVWYEKLTSQPRNTIIWLIEPPEDDIPGHFVCAVGIKSRSSGSIPAYFKMRIPFDSITASIQAAAENVNSIFQLCTQEGTVLWSSEESGYTLDPADLDEDRIVSTIDGGKYGYTVLCIRNTTSPLSSYMHFSKYFLFTLGLIIILSLCILLLSAKLIDGRIVALTTDIKEMDENDLNYCADTSSLDEVGELSRAFAGLIERIKTLNARERQLEAERFELEIQALQAQINPHFLFNTLSIINLLAQEIEADYISKAVNALANFYYISLNDTQRMVSIRDEFAMLEHYLTICSIRYRDNLKIQMDIDPQTLDYYIPKLIIQPFCENAVFHGFTARTPKVPEITITVKLEEEYLLILVSDNGEGMSEEELKRAQETGFAITNVHRRIQMIYGDPYGVTITSLPGEGTKVFIKLGLFSQSFSGDKNS